MVKSFEYYDRYVSITAGLICTLLISTAPLLTAYLSNDDDNNNIDHNADAKLTTTATRPIKSALTVDSSNKILQLALEKPLLANPPIAKVADSNQTIQQDAENVTLDGSKSYDPHGNITLYSWQQIAGPHVKLNSTDTPIVKFNTTCDTLDAELKFKFTVTDNDGLSDSAPVSVKVERPAIPATCKEAVFSPTPLPLSFTVGRSHSFNVNFGTNFTSIDKVAVISSFDPSDPFGPQDAYSIANLGTGYGDHNSSGVNGKGNVGNSGNRTAVEEGNNNTRSQKNNTTNTVLTAKDTNITNQFLIGNFTSNYSSVKGSFTLTSLKFCVKGVYGKPKTGNETSNMPNAVKPISLTVIRPSKVAETMASEFSTSNQASLTNFSVTFDPECNMVSATPTTTANSTALATTTNTTDKVNNDSTTSNENKFGANQNQPALQQGPLYQPSPLQQPQYPYQLAPYPYPPQNPYQQPYPYPYPPQNPYQQPYPYPYPYPPPYPYSPNQPPVANAGANQVVGPGAFVSLDGRGSYDPDGGTITSYRWQQIAGSPTVTLSGANTATPSFIAPVAIIDTTLTFQLTVTDSDQGASSSSTVNVSVQKNNVNQPPIANAGPDQTVNQMSFVSLDGTGSYDPNGGTIVAYSWIQTAGVPVTLSSSDTATPTFTAPIVATDTVLAFNLKVMNDKGIVSNNTAIVYITVKRLL
jgi:hypothetical protein